MKINELRFSFVQFECLAEPLSALKRPGIPFSFLLSGPDYQQEFSRAVAGAGQCQPPWRGGYGKLFWEHYIQRKPAPTKDLWRALVPLYYEPGNSIAAGWLNGTAASRAYLYPWGVGLLVDIAASGSWTLEEAVDLAFQIERRNTYDATVGGAQQKVSLKGLFDLLFKSIRRTVYGPKVAAGQSSDMFSIVTVVDADDVNATEAPEDGGVLHRAMDGLVNWNVHYKTIQLKKLADSTIETKQAPLSHVLYGSRRGRFVWFPGSFRSKAAYEHTLTCYHRNLAVASMQTESLCRITKDAADRLAANPSLAGTSVAYQNCAQLAAGLLGRLYGGTFDTYRSHSLREQIARVYAADVNTVRNYFKIPSLNP